MPERPKLERAALCYGLLALITVAVYLPVIELSFVTFDDTHYVTNNPKVQAGLSWDSIRWAFTRAHAANWHPLTWLSHMLDCELYGLKPAGHHLTNLLLHTANTLLLFGLLKRLTGAFWRSALVAALFALHPLHVESVAWVAERKDVLSTLFFMLTLWAYVLYAGGRSVNTESGIKSSASRIRHPESSLARPASHPRSPIFYLLSLLFFALGLMSKPMLVTLPCVLLLLDYWPLRRVQLKTQDAGLKTAFPLLLEKIPYFALSAASCVITLIAQRQGGAVAALEGTSGVSLESRIINMPISYVWYLAKLVWPSDLAVIYPYVREWPLPQVLLATALLVVMTGLVLWHGPRLAYLATGWFWFLGTLVPVIGLVKVGTQSIADRYTYIPAIGLFIAFAWGLADLTASWPKRAVPLAVGATTVLAACALTVGVQLRYWVGSETLFRHALAATRNNYMAANNLGYYFAEHGEFELAKAYYRRSMDFAPTYAGARNNLGTALVQEKKYAEAVAVFEDALRLNPRSADIESNLGAALNYLDKADEAIAHLRSAIQLDPEHAMAHYHMGNALLQKEQFAEAADEFRLAAQLNPRSAGAYNNLGLVLVRQGKLDEAVEAFAVALRLEPNNALTHYHLATTLGSLRRTGEAIQHYREALKTAPDFAEALNNLAWILAANPDAAVRNGAEAVALAERACKLTEYKQPVMVGTLAAAYAETGRFAEAVSTAEKARALAEQANETALAAKNRTLLERYRSGQPARDTL